MKTKYILALALSLALVFTLTAALALSEALPQETLLTAGLELLAVAAEAMVYSAWRKEFPHPWRFSLLLNLFSFGTGLLLRLLI